MNFNKHLELEGSHAFLGASKYHWLNYSDDKLAETYKNYLAVERGTRLHALAKEHIELGIKMPKTRTTLNMYINDCIGYDMTPEQVLYYSPNVFGTTDAIKFSKKLLRVFDLKTGFNQASMNQIKIYDAIFCLEYKVNPFDISYDNRIYQFDDIFTEEIDAHEIRDIMDRAIRFDKIVEEIKSGVR